MRNIHRLFLSALVAAILSATVSAEGPGPGDGSRGNPFMPDQVLERHRFQFRFGVPQAHTYQYVDPEVALGYEYEVLSGSAFGAVVFPMLADGDNLYDVYLNDDLIAYRSDLPAETELAFPAGGVSRFRVLGIETDAGLDPTDPTVFVTGLTFVGHGSVEMTMTAIVPEPGSVALLPLVGLALRRRR